MWQSVVMQAVIDALDHRKSDQADFNKADALRWLRSKEGSQYYKDLELVCELAELDVYWIRRGVKKALEEQQLKMLRGRGLKIAVQEIIIKKGAELYASERKETRAEALC